MCVRVCDTECVVSCVIQAIGRPHLVFHMICALPHGETQTWSSTLEEAFFQKLLVGGANKLTTIVCSLKRLLLSLPFSSVP